MDVSKRRRSSALTLDEVDIREFEQRRRLRSKPDSEDRAPSEFESPLAKTSKFPLLSSN